LWAALWSWSEIGHSLRRCVLLVCAKTFMTFPWYSHLRNWNDKSWFIAAILSA
jgi:uncharacterized protein